MNKAMITKKRRKNVFFKKEKNTQNNIEAKKRYRNFRRKQ